MVPMKNSKRLVLTFKSHILITPGQKYSLLQRGFVTLELKYKRRQEELAKVKEESQIQAEGYALRIIELTNELETKDRELAKVSDEVGNVSYATRAVESIVDQVRSAETSEFRYLPTAHPALRFRS
jgi:hypothetical protein